MDKYLVTKDILGVVSLTPCVASLRCLREVEGELFSPPLPTWKRGVLARAGCGLINKIFLKFEKPFWDATLDFFGCTPLSADDADRGAQITCFTGTKVQILTRQHAGPVNKCRE